MAYYDTYYETYNDIFYDDYPSVVTPHFPDDITTTGVVQRRMVLILATVLLVIVPLLVSVRPTVTGASTESANGDAIENGGVTVAESGVASGAVGGLGSGAGELSAVFTPEIRFWEPQIVTWAETYGLDPNLVAIIMQIESCGDPAAVSVAGAQGLFQVMPFHFAAGENALDPETNARRGLSYFVERLNQTNGDVGRAFAGYNGGHVAAAGGWDDWVDETQRYYIWSTGIYSDIQAGHAQSTTIQEWLQAGGASLCRQAAGRLGL